MLGPYAISALTWACNGCGPIATDGGQVAFVPVALYVAFDVDTVSKSRGDAENWSRKDELLDLCTRLRGAVDVDGVRCVDAADLKDAFPPADDLIAEANPGLLVTDVERLAAPKVQQ